MRRRRRVDDHELRDAAVEDRERRALDRARHADAIRSNLGLGQDIRAGLIDPTEGQLDALRQIVCQLLVRHYRELIAYGAGWTDPRTPTARRRHRPPGTTAPRRDQRRRTPARARRPQNRDAFIIDARVESTVDLDSHRAASDLALDDEPDTDAA